MKIIDHFLGICFRYLPIGLKAKIWIINHQAKKVIWKFNED